MLDFLKSGDFLKIVMTIFTILGSVITYSISRWLFSKSKINKTDFKMIEYSELVSIVDCFIDEAVVYMNQTFVEDRKNDGDFSSEDKIYAFKEVKNRVMNQLTCDVKLKLENYVNDIEEWIETKIENSVSRNKTDFIVNCYDDCEDFEEMLEDLKPSENNETDVKEENS